MEFFPSVNQQQTEDNFSKTFLARDLPEIVTFRKAQAAQNTKNSLHRMVREAIEEEKPVKEIILEIKESMTRTSIQEQDAIVMVCTIYYTFVYWRSEISDNLTLHTLKKDLRFETLDLILFSF